MNVMSLAKFPLIVTIGALLVSTLNLSVPWLWLLFVLVAATWFMCLYRLVHYKNEYLNIIDRVGRLKRFSQESQQLVCRELALVQKDVSRVKGIVGDSIDLLQNNFSEMQRGITTYLELLVLIKSQNQQPQGLLSANHLSEAKKRVEEVLKKIDSANDAIKSIDDVSHRVALLATNSSLDAAQMSSASARQAANVAFQVDCIARQSFGLTDTIKDSASLIDLVAEEITLINDIVASSNILLLPDDFPNEIMDDDYSAKIKESIAAAIRALQFEDMISQIAERVVLHIGDIRFIVDMLSRLYEVELSDTFEYDLDNMVLELERIKESLSDSPANKVVSQKSMEEGDVELF